MRQQTWNLCNTGGSTNPTVRPGSDTSLPGVSGTAPGAAVPTETIALAAGGSNGTAVVPQSLIQSNTTDVEGKSMWECWSMSVL